MTMTDRSAGTGPGELATLLVAAPTTAPMVVLEERPAAPPGVLTCSERLPRDVLVRLAALTRQVGDIRQEHAAHPGLALRLDAVAANLAALVQSIHDETVLHFVARRG